MPRQESTNPKIKWEDNQWSVTLPLEDGRVVDATWKPGVTYVVRIREAGGEGLELRLRNPDHQLPFIDLKPDTEYELRSAPGTPPARVRPHSSTSAPAPRGRRQRDPLSRCTDRPSPIRPARFSSRRPATPPPSSFAAATSATDGRIAQPAVFSRGRSRSTHRLALRRCDRLHAARIVVDGLVDQGAHEHAWRGGGLSQSDHFQSGTIPFSPQQLFRQLGYSLFLEFMGNHARLLRRGHLSSISRSSPEYAAAARRHRASSSVQSDRRNCRRTSWCSP